MREEELIECSQCGHLHFDAANNRYIPCDICSYNDYGLTARCPFAAGDADWASADQQ